ncbi:LysR family transcriptional regulator [Pseudonocardia ammonioxydans]|uniref:LysR family transcriptional regulator n=1 Tax=Pseudonocardia ammonioxydans TaxID=260086 RepID=UPI001FEB38A3|nr:LysR family transcriptional regulator [Pseudonocardia ammonioxydans]
MTLRQLRYFIVLTEELNYHRAAARLFISQPALSNAIKQLESQFGVALFERSTREVHLTDVGASWLPEVRNAVALVDGAVDHLSILSGGRWGRFRLGYLIGTGADLVFDMVRSFELAHPDIAVEPEEYDFSDPTAGLADGTASIALIRPPVDVPRLRSLVVDSETWVACLSRDHPLADRVEVRIGELLDDPIIAAPESAGGWRDHWLATDVRAGVPPTVAAVATTYEAEITCVARGLGISFTTASSARLYQRPGVVYVPIVDRPPSRAALAWVPESLTPEGELFLRHVRRQREDQQLGR